MSSSGQKRSHVPKGRETLECLCLRDGTLDVSLITGEVTTRARGRYKQVKLSADKDGYLHFNLSRERKDRRGKPEIERRGGKEVKRYRIRRYVRVHRLVKMKDQAIKASHAARSNDWRSYVKNLPRGVDVNHVDFTRDNNANDNLTLQTEAANRGRREMTQEELDAIAECTF